MTPQIQQWVKRARKEFIKLPGKILEIGSLNINGGVRELFLDAQEYIGIDMMKGEGVNKIMEAHDIRKSWPRATFDTVICLEMLEHDNAFWKTVDNMHQVLKRGGFLIVSTPTFGFPLHRYPKDYFRFGEDAYREIIFKDFEILRLSEIRDIEYNPGICCIGRKK